eukprot:309553-Amphidinium_carterae.1
MGALSLLEEVDQMGFGAMCSLFSTSAFHTLREIQRSLPLRFLHCSFKTHVQLSRNCVRAAMKQRPTPILVAHELADSAPAAGLSTSEVLAVETAHLPATPPHD